jgi:DNA-binding PadR family transcriptional regulator
MNAKGISVLGYAMLGLIQQKPSSGYDLRKIFAETAMGNYSSSPGAIYPALERLEAGGLICSEIHETSGLRRRRVFCLSSTGDSELKKWLLRPLARSDVMRGADEPMLRFAFIEHVLGVEAAIGFLQGFQAEILAYLPGLRLFLQDNATRMTLSARLALESGIRSYECLEQWSQYAIQTYRQSQSTPSSNLTNSTKEVRHEHA